MAKYLEKVKELVSAFSSFDIRQILRLENTRADLLSKLAMLAPAELPKDVFFEVLKCLSTEESRPMMEIDHEPSWIDPLITYLRDGVPPRMRKKLESSEIKPPDTSFMRANRTRNHTPCPC